VKEIEALTAIPYPTPYMQGLFPSLGVNLTQLENLVNMPSTDDASGHRQMLNTLNDSLITHHEALALFLAHPTRRLLDLLMTAVVQAEEATGWLIRHPLASPFATPHDSGNELFCERVRKGIADWRLSVHLSSVYHDLDELPVKPIH